MRQPLTTVEGLTSFLSGTDEPPLVPDLDGYLRMSPDEREKVNRERIDRLGNGLTITTPQLESVIRKVLRLILLNRSRSSGRAGLMISGESGTGKTTAAKAAMKYVYVRYRNDLPDFEALNRIPIVYVEVPPGSTGKALAAQFARFLGLPLHTRDTLEYLLHLVSSALTEVGTRLVVVDEIHNLHRRNPGNSESVDVLKSLSNQIPATFVYSGINIHQGHLLTDERGRQIAGRFGLERLGSFGIANPSQMNMWKLLIESFEQQLGLFNHRPGDLKELARYLHDRTQGSIGSLSHLLLGAAQGLIFAGTPPDQELITKEVLDEISLDIAAEMTSEP
ncbi:TniB family NTP-binding protein [Pseudarthrobacter sp. CCNWLW207]